MIQNGQSGKNLDFSCTGERAVVTGAGSGIGRVIAEALLDSGARVCVCDSSATALAECRRLLPAVHTLLADVSDARRTAEMFAEVASTFGGLDVLVNNAGIAGPVSRVEELPPEEIERIMSVNVGGMFNCARGAIPLLRAAGGGSIVNISSVAGRVGYSMRSAYSTSKWAVVGLTKSLAAELGPDNIRVNAIMPGVVEGERHAKLYRAKAASLGITYQEAEERFFDQVSLRRNVTPRDIAAAVVFFCSPAAYSVSGQALGVCGDIQYMRQ